MEEMRDRLARLEKAPEDFDHTMKGSSEAVLSRRPDEKNWAPKEIICHMRDTDELFLVRLQSMKTLDEPKLPSAEAARWAEDRQYIRENLGEALAAFRSRRQGILNFLRGLEPVQWERAGLHPTRGRMTIKDMAAFMVEHDRNHLEQLRRAIAGQA